MAFDARTILDQIKDQYLNDPNPRAWIVGFSGGKDSTMLLQLVWEAIKTIPETKRERRVYVVCNNTLVENPKIIDYTNKVLEKIHQAAQAQRMPITVHHTTPKLEETFWVNLIGKGYPAPNNIFRWCTERLKINPTTQFILEKINEQGEVIILLGTRIDESVTRATSIKKHQVQGQRLRKHVLPNAYVFAPITEVLTDEVWQYLLQVQSPWGASNRELVTIYRNANSGDCPLVIDDTTPSCGNSRFGCWVCTVVTRDRAMEAQIGNGEDWMEPLMELRDLLSQSRDDPSRRQKKRRDGKEGEGILGPYTKEFRVQFLEKLLTAQRDIQISHPEISLISYQELVGIQVMWYRDSIFNPRVGEIYNHIFETRISFETGADDRLVEKELLKEVCADNPEDFNLINELLDLQKAKTLLMNTRGLQLDLENRLHQFNVKAQN
jgi:DNA sulfur modification protein DndC